MSPKDDTTRSRGIFLLPNLFTLAALFAGFYAIIAGMRGHFDDASIAIFIAILMDALDGRVARLTNTQTDFGQQLDSLSDMVSAGVAPALVAYSWALSDLGKIGWLAAFVFAAAVALRLAKFNISGASEKRYFFGLPSPGGAAFVASLVWVGHEYGLSGHVYDWLMAIMVVLTAALMLSNIKYRSFKDVNLKGSVPFMVIVGVVIVFVLVAIDPPRTLLIFSFAFAVSGPVLWLWHKWRG